VLWKPDGTRYYFCPPTNYLGAGTGLVCHLRKVSDIHGNAITVRRNNVGLVYEVLDTLQRSLKVAYHEDTRLIKEIVDWTGRAIKYFYDLETADLVRVEYPPTIYFDQLDRSTKYDTPFEEYSYAQYSQPNTGSSLYFDHNLTAIKKSGEAPEITIEYDLGSGYASDKAIAHTI
jgi:hypothetical protein